MNRSVKLFISGLHLDAEAENEKLETFVPAEYFKKNDSHYLLYEERQEGFEKASKNRIKFKADSMELIRQGLMQTHMVFEKNKKHMTRYVTPYGVIMLGIDTRHIAVEESENKITVAVEYLLEADGEYLSDCKLQIRIEEM